MSQELIARSPDLKRLRDEGYDVSTHGAYLLLGHVPYVNARKEVAYGTLVSDLTLANDITAKPGTHVAYFIGEHPCNREGQEITGIKHSSGRIKLDGDLYADHSFSNKPADGYNEYHEKMTRYLDIISHPAFSLDPNCTAKVFPVIHSTGAESVFKYVDTASSRAGICAATRKFEGKKIAIVGLGGTGSYVLDLISKTPVQEIHLFDGDIFLQHNAFRAPGAASGEDLEKRMFKVEYFTLIYSKMRRSIVPHPYFVRASNVEELLQFDFVFLCMDSGESKRLIIEKLERSGTGFIDVGMGLYEVEDRIAGTLRVTTSTSKRRDHVKKRISLAPTDEHDEYSRNIQIVELNALNAALAVVKWKKLWDFYVDFETEHHATYTINGNSIANEEIGWLT